MFWILLKKSWRWHWAPFQRQEASRTKANTSLNPMPAEFVPQDWPATATTEKQTFWKLQGLYSLSGKTPYHQISWSHGAARLDVILIVSHWNLAGISAALLPMCLSNFRAIRKVLTRISRLRDFTRFCGKTSVRLVNRGPAILPPRQMEVGSAILWIPTLYARGIP